MHVKCGAYWFGVWLFPSSPWSNAFGGFGSLPPHPLRLVPGAVCSGIRTQLPYEAILYHHAHVHSHLIDVLCAERCPGSQQHIIQSSFLYCTLHFDMWLCNAKHFTNFTTIDWYPCKMGFPKGSLYYRELDEHFPLHVWKLPLLNSKTAVPCLSHAWRLSTYFKLLVTYYFRKSGAGDFQVWVWFHACKWPEPALFYAEVMALWWLLPAQVLFAEQDVVRVVSRAFVVGTSLGVRIRSRHTQPSHNSLQTVTSCVVMKSSYPQAWTYLRTVC